jgi:hypothetical protein
MVWSDVSVSVVVLPEHIVLAAGVSVAVGYPTIEMGSVDAVPYSVHALTGVRVSVPEPVPVPIEAG